MIHIKAGNVIMCEFISHTVQNKHVLVNTIFGDMLVSAFPAEIQTAFLIELFSDIPGKFDFEIALMLGSKRVGYVKGEVEFENGKPAIIVLPNAVLKVEKPTTLRITIEVAGSRKITLLKKSLTLLSPSASPQLGEQSQTDAPAS